jgi:hypothetical protein
MTSTTVDALLRGAFAPARALEPNAAEVAAVLVRVKTGATPARSHRGTRRALVPALAALLVLLAAAYAVPPTRAAIDDAVGGVAGAFDGWVSGDEAVAPGRAVRPGEPAPRYFDEGTWSEVHVNDPRVIAEAGGYELFAFKERGGGIGFDLGDTGIGMGGFDPADFRRPLCVLGAGTTEDTDPDGPIPYFGVTAPNAAGVELAYDEGPPETRPVGEGGFVVLVDRSREPVKLTVYDKAGSVLGSVPLSFHKGVGGPEPSAAASAFC